MPKYYEDKEEDSRPCSGVREDLRTCLLQLDCVLKHINVQSMETLTSIKEVDATSKKLRTKNAQPRIKAYGQCHCLKEGKTLKQCLKEGHCKALQLTFFECKRSMLDNRTRFRGRKGY